VSIDARSSVEDRMSSSSIPPWRQKQWEGPILVSAPPWHGASKIPGAFVSIP
jgi:hypothetical protein